MPEQRPPDGALVVLPFLDGPRTVVVVAGDADMTSAARLQEQLIRTLGHGTRALVVDLSDLGVCDLQGAGALSTAVQVAQACGVAVSLRGEPPDVAQLLRTAAHRP
jgi:anti-sigma B factor antagonist